MYTIEKINETTFQQFMEILSGIFEHSPWIAEQAEGLKPFHSIYHLHQEMVNIVKNSSLEQKLALIKAHPNLGERVAMTADSNQEQKGAGLQSLTPAEYNQLITMNQRYMDKFGFPFILAVRGKNKQQIYQSIEERLHHSKEVEFEIALTEIYKIALLRLEEKMTDHTVM
ncbi:2-oxo-4-hydroxy-4-carboxy-5-ureidoimidazoline decarboxylase [Bacillus sp. ISL-18]|uniref:2-oxo-4-hydroxy-4-carboxy-5-ureidoimidazoline decarboxylase n=1 Tax=Bacillus sp. ISL-18 TaxID=2819118 RepID=UPI001BEA078F|nr:2-oxo-4-hydroxy-4-carboxy-5-ureidoimidazoline decarboxylase [Bacillus sp. ISL-18]MBT2655665.1 2-oxo-4-hydroxy-4-carboxy-5-ureidoimidazoline decarboxylase [Bacillus sp. ISL-18]